MMKNEGISVLKIKLTVLVFVESNVQNQVELFAFPYITSDGG